MQHFGYDLSTWLDAPTPAGWAAQALDQLDATLCDHAHCEKKAAASAIALINAYPSDGQLVALMCGLAEEELGHFREIIALLGERGVELGRDPGDPYVQHLFDLTRKANDQRKLDRLLISALVEARSCERFALLVEAARARTEWTLSESIADMFHRFGVSEAGHAALFTGLALRSDADAAKARLAELRQHESRIMLALPIMPRIH